MDPETQPRLTAESNSVLETDRRRKRLIKVIWLSIAAEVLRPMVRTAAASG